MELTHDEIGFRGRRIKVRALDIDGQRYVITGRFPRVVRLKEEWYEDVEDPESVIRQLKESRVDADLFTFWQRLPDTEPKYDYPMERVGVAALPITSRDHWWKKQINAKTRNMVRKAKKKGVETRVAQFDDDFVRGMTEIFNEAPMRQGKPFWHYGKTFDTIKRTFCVNLHREILAGAYCGKELIGFSMLGNAGSYAITGEFLSKIAHRDKATSNALMEKLVEICEEKGFSFLVYGFWRNTTLGKFARYNGFEKFDLPRYCVPMTVKGKIILELRLHHGAIGIVPGKMKEFLKDLRKKWYTGRTL